MKYKPSRDLPEFARECKTFSPSKLAEIVLNRRNEEITPESVTMWFKRHPNHFWRHMFFQHMLRLTDWNYAVVAALGGCTVQSLMESYGKPPEAIVRQWGLKYMPSLEASEIMPIQILEQPSLEV